MEGGWALLREVPDDAVIWMVGRFNGFGRREGRSTPRQDSAKPISAHLG